jgi:hypothetical protein
MNSDYGSSQAQTAQNTGQNAINSFDPNATANKTSQGYGNLWNQQNSTQNDFINSYKQAISNNPSVTDLYNQGNEKYNVNALAANANQLQNAVLQAPQQSLDAARGFNYDQNQVANQTNLTLGRLSPLASAAQNNLSTAQGLASQYVTAGQAQNAQNLLPVQAQQSYLTDLYARQASGWTTASEQEYNGLVAKMNAGISLSDQEMQRANQLAQAQSAYNTAQQSNQYKVLNPAQTLANTLTGTTQKF